MNFKELTTTTAATAVILAIFLTSVTGRFVPKIATVPSQDPSDVSSASTENLPAEEEAFSIQTNQLGGSGSNLPLSEDQSPSSISSDLETLPEELALDLVAPLILLDESPAPPSQEPASAASIYDNLMRLRDNVLGAGTEEPGVAIASNSGNVNIDFHYNPVYTVYGHLTSMKDYLLGNSTTRSEMFLEPPEALKTAQDAFNANLELILRGVTEGLLPKVERIRRDADSERRTFIDVFINFLGALMGRQQCSEIIACRTGKFVAYQVPGAGVLMMITENIIPLSIRPWFSVVKSAVLDRGDDCDVEYQCTLVDDQ